jgi:hypothetical protein
MEGLYPIIRRRRRPLVPVQTEPPAGVTPAVAGAVSPCPVAAPGLVATGEAALPGELALAEPAGGAVSKGGKRPAGKGARVVPVKWGDT